LQGASSKVIHTVGRLPGNRVIQYKSRFIKVSQMRFTHLEENLLHSNFNQNHVFYENKEIKKGRIYLDGTCATLFQRNMFSILF
jgi:hypothetical protein